MSWLPSLPRRVVTSIVVPVPLIVLLAALSSVPREARGATDPCHAFPSLSFTSVAVGQQARYSVTASAEFARLDVKLRWSDGPEDALVSLLPGQSHVFTHTFRTPGNYSAFITASGPLAAGGGCSVFEANLGILAVTQGTSPTGPSDDDDDGNGGSNGATAQTTTCSGFGDDANLRLPRVFAPRAEPAATEFCPQRPRGALRWNRPSAIPALDAGDEAIVSGPDLSTTQRTATITLRTSTGDVAVTLTEDDARYRRFARRSCVYVAMTKLVLERLDMELAHERDSSIPAEAFVGILGLPKHLVPCLKRIDDAIARQSRAARSASVSGARAAAVSCRTGAFPIKVVAGTNVGNLRIRSRRSDPLPNVLRVTCSRTRTSLVVHVKPRRSGVRLRQLVGKRLSIGLLRPPGTKGSAQGTITFRR